MIDTKWIKRDDTPKSIFNPMRIDFITSIRDDDNKPKDYIILSMESKTYPAYITNIIIKKLIRAIQDERSVNYLDKEKEDEIRKEIEVK